VNHPSSPHKPLLDSCACASRGPGNWQVALIRPATVDVASLHPSKSPYLSAPCHCTSTLNGLARETGKGNGLCAGGAWLCVTCCVTSHMVLVLPTPDLTVGFGA
jgi:hypothetical protein